MNDRETIRQLATSTGHLVAVSQIDFFVEADAPQLIADAVDGAVTRVIGMVLQCGSVSTTFAFVSGNEDTDARVGALTFAAAREVITLDRNVDGWFESLLGESLSFLTNDSDVSVTVTYCPGVGGTARSVGHVAMLLATQTEVGTPHNATITVYRASGFQGSISFDYATADGTAAAGVNYTSATGTKTIADGVDSVTITVPIITGHATLDKTFTVTISNAGHGGTIGSPSVDTVTISHL